MRIFVPGEIKTCTPQWWRYERYDYCDISMVKNDADNLFNKVFRKISGLFA